MALFNWADNYSVGIPSMDDHHKKIFSIANILYDAMKAGKTESVIDESINELIDYTEYHFAEEERLMEKIHYDGLSSQKAAHKSFIFKLKEIQQEMVDGNVAIVSIKLSQTVVDWLIEHIATMDKKYEQFMKADGIT